MCITVTIDCVRLVRFSLDVFSLVPKLVFLFAVLVFVGTPLLNFLAYNKVVSIDEIPRDSKEQLLATNPMLSMTDFILETSQSMVQTIINNLSIMR